MKFKELDELQLTQEDLDNINKTEGSINSVYKLKRLLDINCFSKMVQTISGFGIFIPWLMILCMKGSIEIERIYLASLVVVIGTIFFAFNFIKHNLIMKETNKTLKSIQIVEK